MRLDECKIGMRVECVEPFDGNIYCVGLCGTIVQIDKGSDRYPVVVAFDTKFAGGWRATENCAEGCGYYGHPDSLIPISDEVPDIAFSFEQLFN